MVGSAIDRILTRYRRGECHFHDTPFRPDPITGGKGTIQTMLAEVNNYYPFVALAVSNREQPTENWHFREVAPMGPVK
jgi:hypothetical protein